MKVLCSACEAAEASVLCCADEAALCARCDREVHAANRLAGKHQRVPLLAPCGAVGAAVLAPKCDICQECQAYFFCLEDRALLCRSCDVAVHTANAFVSAHRRFLLTGVQVGLEVTDQAADPPDAGPVPLRASPSPTPKKSNPATLYSESDINWDGPDVVGITGTLPDWSVLDEQFSSPSARPAEVASKTPPKRSPRGPVAAAGSPAVFGGQGGMAGGMTDWPLDEFFGFSDFNGGFGFAENGTSKADSAKLGSTDGSLNYRSTDEDQNAQEFFGQVPEIHCSVPEIQCPVPELPSPPTASGLHWQRSSSHHGAAAYADSAAFVPDICSPENPFLLFTAGHSPPKRQRKC